MRTPAQMGHRRGELITEARQIVAQRSVTGNDRKRFETLMGEADLLAGQIQGAEERDAARAPKVDLDEYGSAFRSYLRKGITRMPQEERSILQAGEFRQMGTGGGNALQGTGGGYFVPVQFAAQVESAMKYYGPMLAASTPFDTVTGGPFAIPMDNDTESEGEQVDENAQASANADVPTDVTVLNDFLYSSKFVKASFALVQDAGFDLQSYLGNRFGIRIGRTLNRKFTTGTGTGEPKGILTSATLGATAAGSANNTGGAETGATTIGSDDLTSLEHSVDPTYRLGASYMMHDNTLAVIKKVKDKQGRPLWMPPLIVGAPGTINGYPALINNSLPTIAASAKTVLFGALYKYAVRNAGGLFVLRLDERFVDYRQVGFIAFARRDGRLLDAGTHPVKYLQMASS